MRLPASGGFAKIAIEQVERADGRASGRILARRCAMARRRGDATPSDGDGPTLITLDEQHHAVRLLNQAYQAGEIDQDELQRRLARVHRAVTPRDLWKASGHRAGSRKRSDLGALKHAVLLQVGIVGFAMIAMLLVLYGVILYYHGDNSGASVWPWDWGKS
jgi:Domain of unknown function (DUF1707)